MLFSAYQIESLLEDFQKNFFHLEKSSSETLSISEDAFNESRQNFRNKPPPPIDSISKEKINDLIEDKTKYDPIVDYVQQRRAGRFVTPEYIPENPAPPFSLVNEFNQNKKSIEKQKKEVLLDSSSYNSFDKTNIILNRKANEDSEKLIQLDRQNNLNEEISNKFKKTENNSSNNNKSWDIDDEDNYEESILFSGEINNVIDDYNDIVFGEGPIVANSIKKFVSDYPDSAIKFLLRKNIDGRPLPVEYEKIYQKWEDRGLSRGRLKKYLFDLMKWKEFPDIPILDVLRIVREYLFDMREKKQ